MIWLNLDNMQSRAAPAAFNKIIKAFVKPELRGKALERVC